MGTNLFDDSAAVYIDGDKTAEVVRDTYLALRAAKLVEKTADMIAYTEDFERLYERVRSMLPITRNEVFVALINSRKRGELGQANRS